MDLDEFLAEMGRLATCDRCGALCRATGPKNPKARIMRRAKRPHGYCANCSMTQWLRSIDPLPMVIDKAGREALLNPAVQSQVYAVLKSAEADAEPSEIDWREVLRNWDLPLLKGPSTV